MTLLPPPAARRGAFLAALILPAAAGAAERHFLRGDSNGDQSLDIADPIHTLAYLFSGGVELACLDAADSNDDGEGNIADPIFTLGFLFTGGSPPPAPYPLPGTDPTPDPLQCLEPSGILLVAIHGTPPAELTEFWITIEKLRLGTTGDTLQVFPPAPGPGATKEVNLLDLVRGSAILTTIEVPAGKYTRLELEFDGAFARAGTEDVIVRPDHGNVNVAFAAPIAVEAGNLTALVLDFNLALSLTDGGPGRVLLEPLVEHDDGHPGLEIAEFHATVLSVDAGAGTLRVEVAADQGAPAGRVTVATGPETRFEGGEGLASLSPGVEVEVEGTLSDDGYVISSALEIKTPPEDEELPPPGVPVFLVIDEDSIDNGNPPNHFSDTDVNDHLAEIGVRSQLPFFAANPDAEITLHTGQVGDEGFFAPRTIPESWVAAGPTEDGLRNYIEAGPGLGAPDGDGDRESLLDKIPDVTPLRGGALESLVGRQVCAVVHDSDISMNYDPLEGSLKGANLGTVAFEVLSATPLSGFSSSSLPAVRVKILDAMAVCEGPLALFTGIPVPGSSSDLDDDGIDDAEEDPDHDTDIDNDGVPNVEDPDDDGDGVDDGDDADDDNDGVDDDEDADDDNDGVDDGEDRDDDGDGVDDEEEGDDDEDDEGSGGDDDAEEA